MHVLFAFLLRVFHFIYSAIITARSFWKRYSAAAPQPLRAARQRVPKHLGIIFTVASSVSDEAAQSVLTESTVDAVSWCRTVGIQKLTVYEENDLLSKCVQRIRERLPIHGQDTYASDSETEYPITPPPSDYSESRPLSPNHHGGGIVPVTTIHVMDPVPRKATQKLQKLRRRQQKVKHENTHRNALLLCLASRESSKGATVSQKISFVQRQCIQSFRNRARPNIGR
ncbi:hypothetical protein GALMADRAFT_301911 [Galerina marginata CBS 339.88]|uniref:ditrans,polycis-polyprenyl diphosphate synthase [(2E,6E)-farnesyldiphosphate specific] n=1 Tax=Galerina marginata (strain CBS 339.88) TaxID=685588 RepID=A0A067TRP2_GALM3|nr:hypothetical protein GALMADRAFT_301911 [Galerina marginata CBS 339.88]